MNLALGEISVPDPTNGRLELDPVKVERLSRQIDQAGLLHPITVRLYNGRYELIAGRHRLAAVATLRWSTIPAILVTADDQLRRTLRLAENCTRSALTPVEEATQLAELVNDHPTGVDGIARDLGRSTSWVLDRLDMAAWPDYLLALVHDGRISMAAGKRLAKIEPETLRHHLVSHAAANGINARTAAQWLEQARLHNETPTDVVQDGAPLSIVQFQTTTTVLCFICREQVDLNTAKQTHICTECLTKLQQAPA